MGTMGTMGNLGKVAGWGLVYVMVKDVICDFGEWYLGNDEQFASEHCLL